MKEKLNISKDDLLKACIHVGSQESINILQQQAIHPNNLVNVLTDNIYSKIKGINNFHENLQKCFGVDPLISDRIWYLYNLSGLTTIWEFNVRTFAARIGIKNNTPIEKKSRKSRSLKTIHWLPLTKIIEQLSKKISSKLDLQLKELSELRNSIVHSNFQELRIKFNLPNKKIKDSHKSNVRTLNLSTNEVKNLSEDLSENQIESEDIVIWLLEAANFQLLSELYATFHEKTALITTLITLQSYSFGEVDRFFEKIVISGEKLSHEEEEKFIKHLIENNKIDTIESNKKLIQDIYKYFKN